MKKTLFFLVAGLFCQAVMAQDVQQISAEAAKVVTAVPPVEQKVEKPKYWATSLKTQVNVGQTGLTNWAAGGDNTVTLQGFVDANANWAKNAMFWNNRLQLDYGFVYASSKPIIQKSSDRIYLESKWGYKAVDNLYLSANYDFKSQFSSGWVYNTPAVPADKPEGTRLEDLDLREQIRLWEDARVLKSNFLAPAYTNIALGIDYKPTKWISVNFAPLTGGFVIVNDAALRKNYSMDMKDNYLELQNEFAGVDPATITDEVMKTRYDYLQAGLADGNAFRSARFEFGAQLKVDFAVNVNDNFKYTSQVVLFSNYLKNPQNPRVNWDNRFDWKLAKFFSLTITTNLIYDDTIMIYSDKDQATHQRIQFKEALAFGFTYTIAGK